MFALVSKSVKDTSVLRRLQFAAAFLPKDIPKYGEAITSFALTGKEDRNSLNPAQAVQIVENLAMVDSAALASDVELTREIVAMKRPESDAPIGYPLISNKSKCGKCGSKLYIRESRFSSVTLYHDQLGTLPGTHYTRYCRRKGCSFQQHYGYYTEGDCSEVMYDSDWSEEQFFMSTRETGFCMDMLRRLDKEILIGQISYKQRADLYNAIHGEVTQEQMYSTILYNTRIVYMQA